MVRLPRAEFAGALYHVTARGHSRQNIYHDDDDRCNFLDLLQQTCSRYFWLCYAHCPMPNHHLETQAPALFKEMHVDGVGSQIGDGI